MNRSRRSLSPAVVPASSPAPVNPDRLALLAEQLGAVVPFSAWGSYSPEVRRAVVVGVLVGNGANPFLDREEAALVGAVVAAVDVMAGVAPSRARNENFGRFVAGARVFVRWDCTMRPAQIAAIGDNLVRLLVWTAGGDAFPESVDLTFSAFDEILDERMGSWDGIGLRGARS